MYRRQIPDLSNSRPTTGIGRGGTVVVPPPDQSGSSSGSATGGSSDSDNSSGSGITYPLCADTGDQEVPDPGSGQWMHSTATMSSTGVIEGSTHIWCTNDWTGFHGSAVPVLLDKNGTAVWPSDPDAEKHQYGVDGDSIPFVTSDRLVPWPSRTVPADVVKSAVQLRVVQYLDPKNMLLRDLGLIGKTLPQIIALIGEL